MGDTQSTRWQRIFGSVLHREWVKCGLVAIVVNGASGAIRSRIERKKVPTPGLYSTNNLVFGQSTGPSILRISRSEDGTIEPTITGCLRKPWKNMPQGEGTDRKSTRLNSSN